MPQPPQGVTESGADKAQAPVSLRPTRDGLGRLCFAIHSAVVVYILFGWLFGPGLVVYLIFLPVIGLHWPLNKGTCVLNNLESLVRKGQWRDPASREEGAWVRCVIGDFTGRDLSSGQVQLLTHGILVVVWGLAFWHWQGWPLPHWGG